MADEEKKPEGDSVARTAGRGGLAITFAKVYFILLGLVQQILLPRVLGMGGYGALSRALSVSSIAYNPVVTTSIQGVSRAVAASSEAEQPHTIRRVVKVHAIVAIVLGVGLLMLQLWRAEAQREASPSVVGGGEPRSLDAGGIEPPNG